MTVPRVELADVEALIPVTVASGGRISGLGEYTGRKVLVVIPAEEKKPRRRGGGEG